MPTLDPLFAQDRRFHCCVHLEPYCPLDAIASGEAFRRFGPMLPDASKQVAGDTCVESAVGCLGKQIDTGLALDGSI